MVYEAIGASLAGSPTFKDNTWQTLVFQINTKVNPVGNNKHEILQAITCVNDEGVAINFEMAAAETPFIMERVSLYASQWVDTYYNN